MDEHEAPGVDEFRRTVGRFATGVTVVTVGPDGDGHPHGSTVTAFSSVSLSPLLVSLCLGRGSGLLARLRTGTACAVNVLAADQVGIARHYADPRRPRGAAQFAHGAWRTGAVSGAPLLVGALAWLECTVVARHPAGDHEIVLAEVRHTGYAEGAPLLHVDGVLRPLPQAG